MCHRHNVKSVAEEANVAVCPCREEPRLRRVERDIEHACVVHDVVAAQHLDWHNERVAHEVGIHSPVEDVHRCVIAAARKQRVRAVKCGATQRVVVVPGGGGSGSGLNSRSDVMQGRMIEFEAGRSTQRTGDNRRSLLGVLHRRK